MRLKGKMFGIVSILLLAVIFMSIGCGDGKRNHKTGVKKAKPGTAAQKGKGGQPGSPLPGSPEAKEKSKQLSAINAKLNEPLAQATELKQLEAGRYTLKSVVSHFQYIATAGKNSTDVAGIAVSPVSAGSNGVLKNSDSQIEGVIANDTDTGRQVEINTDFEIKDPAAQLARGGSGARLFSTRALFTVKDKSIENKIEAVSPDRQAPSLLELLNTPMATDGARKVKAGGKDDTLAIYKTTNGLIIFKLSVLEKGGGQSTIAFTRTLLFIYEVAKAEAPAPAPDASGPAASPEGLPSPGQDSKNPPPAPFIEGDEA
ncbi:MAG: hypothetical protein AB7F86_14055 [Bdellovibrionales bacterium]